MVCKISGAEVHCLSFCSQGGIDPPEAVDPPPGCRWCAPPPLQGLVEGPVRKDNFTLAPPSFEHDQQV